MVFVSGILVPKAMSKLMFLTETYEALSFCFFLRLIMTYLGGKKILYVLKCSQNLFFSMLIKVIYRLFEDFQPNLSCIMYSRV